MDIPPSTPSKDEAQAQAADLESAPTTDAQTAGQQKEPETEPNSQGALPVSPVKGSSAEQETAAGKKGKPPPPSDLKKQFSSPAEMRKRTSEAQDFASVVQQHTAGQRHGMFVERDAHVYGDMHVHIASGRPASQARERGWTEQAARVPDDEIQRVQYVYQQPKSYNQCYQMLRTRHLLMLLGPAHIGKRATAIHLAIDLLGRSASIVEYAPNLDLKRLTSATWQPNTAYLVDGLFVERIRNLLPHPLRAISSILQEVNSYLILSAHPDAHPHTDTTREFGVPVDLPPASPTILVERHLQFYAGDQWSLADIQEFLKHPRLKPVLQSPLSPQGANDLSQRLLQAMNNERSLEEALQGFTSVARSQMEEWFEEAGDDIEERAFRLALAAFNGARYMAVRGAAQDLTERLTPPAPPPDPDQPPPPPPSPFARRRSSRLERARAHLEWTPEPGSTLPGSQIEIVRFDDPAYPDALLHYVWTEYDNLRGPILEWLSDYVTARTSDMRTRAAASIGALAKYDLVTIRDAVFRRWVAADERIYRAALGKALGVLVWSDERAPDVLALLDEWGKHKDLRFRWAAARAFGEVGLRYPRQAMEQWRASLVSAEQQVQQRTLDLWLVLEQIPHVMSVLDTILDFFLTAVRLPDRYQPVYEEAIESLKEWSDQDRKEKRERKNTAWSLVLFTILVDIPIGDPADESDPETWPPAMLALVSNDPAPSPYRATLAELFRRALNWRTTRQDAVNALKDWLQRVDQNTHLEESMIALLRDIAFDPQANARDRGRLAAYLRRWAAHPRHPLRTAIHARQQLNL